MQKAAVAGALGFLVGGILGFVPGVTTNFDQMTFMGPESGAMLFGIFQVSVLHNAIHLILGAIGLAMAHSWKSAHQFLLGAGLFTMAAWVYGMAAGGHDMAANFVPFNQADNWLNLGVGAVMMTMAILANVQWWEDTGYEH
jgi:hypothetical protein